MNITVQDLKDLKIEENNQEGASEIPDSPNPDEENLGLMEED